MSTFNATAEASSGNGSTLIVGSKDFEIHISRDLASTQSTHQGPTEMHRQGPECEHEADAVVLKLRHREAAHQMEALAAAHLSAQRTQPLRQRRQVEVLLVQLRSSFGRDLGKQHRFGKVTDGFSIRALAVAVLSCSAAVFLCAIPSLHWQTIDTDCVAELETVHLDN